MKKTIMFRMTPERAAELGQPVTKGYGYALRPVEIDTDTLTPAAAFIAEHITATYIVDEDRDKIGIRAVAGFTMRERDIASRVSREMIDAMSEAYGPIYNDDPMRIDEITFPVYGRNHKSPEEVIEITAKQLYKNGAVKLVASNGEEFCYA